MNTATDRDTVVPDLTRPGRFHIVGAGGPGMSAIALVLTEMGHTVSGSDIRDVPVLDRLRAAGATVAVGHRAEHVDGVDAVTISTAIPASNLEVRAARERGVPVLRRATMLTAITRCARSLGVAGTHGKTTTTSMLAMILTEAGLRPSFIVGGEVNEVGTGAHWTGGRWLVVEADESDGTFLELDLFGTVLTNVEADHLDHYGTFDSVVAAFDRYLDGIEGPKVVCLDDVVASRLAARHDVVTYGTSAAARYRATPIEADHGVQRFTVERDGALLGEIRLPLRGIHNVRNATGALALAMEAGAPFTAAAAALGRFGGVGRRFEVRGELAGAVLVDDYAHLPTEIAVVLEAAASSGDDWKRIVAVFQPNRFSRMELLSPEYRDAFVRADVTVLTEIYGSGEAPRPGVTGKLVVDAILDAHSRQRVVWLPHRADLVHFLATELRAGDVCISMGCGDISSLPAELLAQRPGDQR